MPLLSTNYVTSTQIGRIIGSGHCRDYYPGPFSLSEAMQLILNSGTRRWNLQEPNIQISCSDLTMMGRYHNSIPSNCHPTTCLFYRGCYRTQINKIYHIYRDIRVPTDICCQRCGAGTPTGATHSGKCGIYINASRRKRWKIQINQ